LLQSNRHPYLWQSVLWFSPDTEEFSLLPGKGKVALEGFKAGILAGGGGMRILPDLAVIPEQLELRRPSEIPLISDQQSSPVCFISKDDV